MIGCHTGDLNLPVMSKSSRSPGIFLITLLLDFNLIIILIYLDYSRATGDDTRSLCTTVCKWMYLGHAHMQQVSEKDSRDMEACGWDDDFWEEIGLGDLVDGHHAKIGMLVGQFLFCFFSLVTGLLDKC